ncbi:MAG TPA: hypothetical protein VFH51_16070 [Myxococcota bacterium]|nr:hypothetical protein [Myxococcota bacterium]
MSSYNVNSTQDDPFEALRRALQEESLRDGRHAQWNGKPPVPPGQAGAPQETGVTAVKGAFVSGRGEAPQDAVGDAPGAPVGQADLNLNAPELPDPTDPTASPRELEHFVSQKPGGDGVDYAAMAPDYYDSGTLIWMALQVMTDANHQDFSIASRLKQALENAKINEKKNELSATEQRIQGEQLSAATKFLSATTGAVLAMGFGFAGSRLQFMNQTSASAQARGAAFMAGGQAIGNVVTTFGDMVDKLLGGQYDADQASIREKTAQMMQEIDNQGAESLGSWIEAIKDQRKKAQQTLMDYVDRQKQATDMVWR